MSWHQKYWDAVDQFYWTPSHLGLVSVPKAQWGDNPDYIAVPRRAVQNGGSIYIRQGTYVANSKRARALEETLNHLFDITLSIAPTAVVGELIHSQFNLHDSGPFLSLGREVGNRYGWGQANVTQHDGLFVSPNSIVGVELKLNSQAWPEQVIKYLTLFVLEERATGRKQHIGLLYITPDHTSVAISERIGLTPEGKLSKGFIEHANPIRLNTTILRYLAEFPDEFQDVVNRVQVQHRSWQSMVAQCLSIVDGLDQQRPGDETLARLLQGFAAAVVQHDGTACAVASDG